MTLTRPLSPHLTVYKFPLPSILSISFRGTGIALTGLLYGFGLVSAFPLVQHQDITSTLLSYTSTMSPSSILLAKTAISIPFSYHYLNGIRHLSWDLGLGLSLDGVYKTGYACIAATIILSSILIFSSYIS